MSAVLAKVARRCAPPCRSAASRLARIGGVFILRESPARAANPVLFFSGGKDSIVLLRLAEKPSGREISVPADAYRTPGTNFPEVIAFRDDARGRAP